MSVSNWRDSINFALFGTIVLHAHPLASMFELLNRRAPDGFNDFPITFTIERTAFNRSLFRKTRQARSAAARQSAGQT